MNVPIHMQPECMNGALRNGIKYLQKKGPVVDPQNYNSGLENIFLTCGEMDAESVVEDNFARRFLPKYQRTLQMYLCGVAD